MVAHLKPLRSSASSLVRRLNIARLLQVLQEGGPLSRPELSAATGLSQPTVNEIVALLIRENLVIEAAAPNDERPVRRGPKADLLAFNARAGFVIGADIGAEQMVVMLADLKGEIVERIRLDVGPREMLRPEPLLAQFDRAVSATLHKARIARSKLMAVGVGLPAIVDPVSGRATLVPALPDWDGFAVAPRIRLGFDCPVIVNTDVHLACLAESKFGAAQHDGNAVYIHLGVGIGMGILIDGKLFPGSAGAAGQIGNLPLKDGETAPQAGFGMFEWSAGSSSFERLARLAIARAGDGKLAKLVAENGGAITPQLVAEAAALGDRDAKRIVARLGKHLANGIAAVICVLNPRTLILGGEIAQIGAPLIEQLRSHVAALVPYSPQHFVLSSLGDDSVALGAVQTALQEAQDRIFAVSAPKAA